MKKCGVEWPEDMAAALATLRQDRWIYLRDTAHYSVLLETKQDAAYAVKCLTTRLRDLVGGSGAIVQCGLLVFRGQVISDGLLSFDAWIGQNYKRSFNEKVADLREGGLFYRDRLLPAIATATKATVRGKAAR